MIPLASSLGLTEVTPLRDQDGPRQCKIVVFVPDQDLAKVADALFNAGAGHIGNTANAVFACPAPGLFSAPRQAIPPLARKADAKKSANGDWKRSVPKPL